MSHLLWPVDLLDVAEPLEVSLVGEEELSGSGLFNPDTSLRLEPPAPVPKTEEELRAEEEQRRAEEEARREETSVRPPGQVVEIPRPQEEKVPVTSKYVSEYNSTVDKETIRRGRPDEPEGAAPLKGEAAARGQPRPPETAPPPPVVPPTPPQARRLAMRQQPPGQAPGVRGESRTPSRQEWSPDGTRRPQAPRGGHRAAGGAEVPAAPGGAAESRSLTLSDLTPSREALARAIGRGGSVDAVKGVEDGAFTALNTRRWKYATFFNRVKRAVANQWHPDRAYRRRDPSGNVYGFKDRLTVLKVRLNARGGLQDVFVERPCGVGFLDDEAVRAFRRAQPFPNPPKALVDNTGMISFRFGFLFELSSSASFRVFRYRR